MVLLTLVLLVAARLKLGADALACDYVQLLESRAAVIRDAEALLAPYDAMLLPTVPCVPPTIATRLTGPVDSVRRESRNPGARGCPSPAATALTLLIAAPRASPAAASASSSCSKPRLSRLAGESGGVLAAVAALLRLPGRALRVRASGIPRLVCEALGRGAADRASLRLPRPPQRGRADGSIAGHLLEAGVGVSDGKDFGASAGKEVRSKR